MAETYLGVDIGGTAVKLGLLDAEGRILQRHQASVDFDGYRTPILQTVTAEVSRFLQQLTSSPVGIGVSSTGYIDRQTGSISGSWLPGWAGSRVVEALQTATGLPVTLENDGNCMCLGERWRGAGAGCDDLLCLAIGTGIGGCAVAGGQLLIGAHGLAAEVGHLVTHRDGGIPCTCGRSGCWERYASTSALVQQGRAAGLTCDNGQALFRQAAEGLPTAVAVLDHWLEELAEGLVNLIYLFDPQTVLIGGGVVGAGDQLLVPLRQKVNARMMPVYHDRVTIRAAQLGNDAGLIGAVYVLLQSGKCR